MTMPPWTETLILSTYGTLMFTIGFVAAHYTKQKRIKLEP